MNTGFHACIRHIISANLAPHDRPRFFTSGNHLDVYSAWKWGRGEDAEFMRYQHWAAGEPTSQTRGYDEFCLEVGIAF